MGLRVRVLTTSIIGNNNTDAAVGDDVNDTLTWRGRQYTLDGGAGIDRAIYTDATGPITVDMAAGTVSGAGVGNDTLVSVESIRGSAFDDTYVATGYTGASAIGSVPATYNEFEGMAGDDVITGNGNTGLSYLNATAGVTVDLASPTPASLAQPESLMGPRQAMSQVRHRYHFRRREYRPRLRVR